MNMLSLVNEESTLTDRYQTTVPKVVRDTLGLSKKDKLHYNIREDGAVILSKGVESDEDPVLGQFLKFLANDMSNNPQHLKMVSTDLLTRIQSLTSGVSVDLDAPLFDE